MSLRDFHIIFIISAILLSMGFGFWAIEQYQFFRGLTYIITSIFSFLFSLMLIVYEINFIKKIKS